MDVNSLSDEILKTAGFSNIVKNTSKFMKRTGSGAILGAGLGGMKGVSANAANPDSPEDTKELNVAGGIVSGALLGGLAGGVGIGAAKKIGGKAVNKMTPGFMKKSEMEVPTEEEKETKEDKDRRDVEESPNEEEKSRIINSISKHKAEIEKCSISKMAKYMKDIKCEECGSEVTPNSEDGRCPKCGALGGVKPKENPSLTQSAPLQTKDQSMGKLMDEIYNARQNFYNMY